MTLLNTIKRELNALGIKPKKSLGQNFLVNEGIYKKIVAALEIKKGDTIIEVGPGLGTLTDYLAESGVYPVRGRSPQGNCSHAFGGAASNGAKIIAIEKDQLLADYLKIKFANQKNAKPRTKGVGNDFGLSPSGARVTIIEGDILKFKPESYKLSAISYKLVGNIPYYLTSRLLRIVFEKWPRPEKIVLMLQKEVAQRIIAKPPEMSLLAVSVQYYSKPEIISYVSRNSFYPAPEVDSAIIRLVPSEQFTAYSDNVENCKLKTKNFFKIVRAGFRGKRKQLINNLAAGLGIEKEKIKEKLLSAGIDYHRRAETLSIEEWQRITDIFS